MPSNMPPPALWGERVCCNEQPSAISKIGITHRQLRGTPYKVMQYCFDRTAYKIFCLGWYNIGRRSQGFSTHNLNSCIISSVIVVFLYFFQQCSCSFILVHYGVSHVIIIFHPLLTYLITESNPCRMLMILTMLIQIVFKHHTHDEFKQHIRGIW